MSIRHQIKNSDTVEYLADVYMGTPTRWREIVNYNNLVYPYISSDPVDRFKVYASGFVKVTRDIAAQPLTIQRHWTVSTRKNVMSSATKTYQVVEDVTLKVGEYEAFIFVRSVVPGLQGNTTEDSITVLGEDFARNQVFVNITNENPIVGGKEGFVRVAGEYIHIPSEEDTMMLQDYGAEFSYNEIRYFYGDDLKVVDDDLVADTSGDLGTVNFVDNVKQAINRRFTTERGDILTDFTFGQNISDIIGDGKLPMEAKERLVRLDIMECLKYEDRISDPEITRIEVVPHERSCYVDIKMNIVNLGTEVILNNVRIGGMDNV